MTHRYEVISDFINQFKAYGPNVIDCFSNGMCYYFAQILNSRFGPSTKIVYDPIINHFAVEYDMRIYDITGDITDNSEYHWYDWDIYKHEDPLHTERICRDCILKRR